MKKLSVKNCRWIELQTFDDSPDGLLVIAEASKSVPFPIKRAYAVKELTNPAALRGMHAHKKLQQALFSLNGSYEVEMFDGRNRQQVVLDQPHKGLYIGPGVWVTLRSFSKGCILLVFASDHYHESDYIRDFREFRARYSRRKR